MQLSDDISAVKGVGEKTAIIMRRRGLKTVRDLVYYLPRAYNNWQTNAQIGQLRPGNVVFKAKVRNCTTQRARNLKITKAELYDQTGSIEAVWFNQPYREKQLSNRHQDFYFSGNFDFRFGRYQVQNPSVMQATEIIEQKSSFQPIYRQIATLKSANIAKIIGNLKGEFAALPDFVPKQILKEVGVKTELKEALFLTHFPENQKDVDLARTRLAFDELLAWSFSSEITRREILKLKSPAIPFNVNVLKQFVAALPFDLTDDQRRSLYTIAQDLQKAQPMNRLLQGDVGSGKTAVAIGASLLAVADGFQVAVMAPTEVLARQHFDSFQKNTPKGLRIALLVGGLPEKDKTAIKESIKHHQIDIVIGTHALLSDGVDFAKLGLAIIDEQHRFGVRQRQKLLTTSGDNLMPHLLSMTATPIPRSLQLAIFGEIDVSNIKTKPKNRKEIITEITRPVSIETTYQKMAAEIAKGHQVFYICPQIEESEDQENQMKNVGAEFRHLAKIFGPKNVALLHGRMPAEDKTRIMNDFASGKTQILVSTTVIEVGVDVPNANFIVIRNADHFGLASLHQLRGRVGRGDIQSYCVLVTTTNDRPTQRLREMEKSSDGFYLAEKDLAMRGAGEIYGALQHGALSLRIADINDHDTIVRARKAAKLLADQAENDPDFLDTHSELGKILKEKQKTTLLN